MSFSTMTLSPLSLIYLVYLISASIALPSSTLQPRSPSLPQTLPSSSNSLNRRDFVPFRSAFSSHSLPRRHIRRDNANTSVSPKSSTTPSKSTSVQSQTPSSASSISQTSIDPLAASSSAITNSNLDSLNALTTGFELRLSSDPKKQAAEQKALAQLEADIEAFVDVAGEDLTFGFDDDEDFDGCVPDDETEDGFGPVIMDPHRYSGSVNQSSSPSLPAGVLPISKPHVLAPINKASDSTQPKSADEAAKQAAIDAQKAAYDANNKAAADAQKAVEDATKKAAADAQKAADEATKKATADAQKSADEAAKKATADAQKSADDATKKAAADAQKSADDAAKKAAADAQKSADDAAKKATEQAQKDQEAKKNSKSDQYSGSSSNSGSSDSYAPSQGSGETFSGDATFYGTGLGACGVTNNDNEHIVAISRLLFDSFVSPGGNPNLNPVCHRKIQASYKGNSVVVTVTDRCVGCAHDDLDFAPAAFNQLGDKDLGRLHGMTWKWLS